MHAVFLDLASLAEQDLDLSAFATTVDDWRTFAATAPPERVGNIGDAEIVVTNKVVLDDAVLRAAPNVKLICLTATGYNNVDVDTARELGITVCNISGYATDSVVQHVLALMLAHHTRLFDYTAAVRHGDWSRSPRFCLLDYPVRELRGMTLGIVGYGELGHGVARIAEAFGMRVLVSQRPGGPTKAGRVPFAEVLRESDVITLHVPLLDNTHHLIDATALFEPMRKSEGNKRRKVGDDQIRQIVQVHALRGGHQFFFLHAADQHGAHLVLGEHRPPVDRDQLTALAQARLETGLGQHLFTGGDVAGERKSDSQRNDGDICDDTHSSPLSRAKIHPPAVAALH